MLLGQGHAKVDWIPLNEGVLHYQRNALSEDASMGPTGARVGPDSLLQEQNSWQLKVQSGELDARIQFENALIEPPQEDWQDWSVTHSFAGKMQGVIRSGLQNNLVEGHAVGIYSAGTTSPSHRGEERRSAFVLSEDVSIGVDQSGSHATAFAVIAGQQLDASTAVMRKEEEGIHLDFRPNTDLEVWLRPARPHLESDPWEHLYAVERWVASQTYGRPIHRIRAATAQIRLGERQLNAKGLIRVNTFR